MLGNQAHEGLQSPSNLEERKELKETQYAVHAHSAAHPHPPRTRGAISASLEGSPPKPSTAPRASASLEGSEPALEKADRLRPKELSSRTPGVRLHLTGPTVSPRVPEMEMLSTYGHGPGPPQMGPGPPLATRTPRRWVRDLHVPIRTPVSSRLS